MRFLILSALAMLAAACATTEGATPPPMPLPSSGAARDADASALRNITSILIDAEKSYAGAADYVGDQALKDELAELSRQRGRLVGAFQGRVEAMGRRPAETGELLGGTRRLFNQVTRMFDNDIDAALDATLNAENNLVDEVEEALASDRVSDGTKAFLNWHLSRDYGIRDGRDRVEYLRRKYTPR